MSTALPYATRHRNERLIAVGRVILATVLLFAVWQYPSVPTYRAETIYALLTGYLFYAIGLLAIALVWPPTMTGFKVFGVLSHIVDLTIFALLLYATEEYLGPFSACFVFSLFTGALRWQWRGTAWTVLAALAIFLGLGWYAKQIREDPFVELDRLILYAAQIGTTALLLGYLSTCERRRREELALLASWPRDAPSEFLIRDLLAHAANIFGVPRALLIWEEAEEPWLNLATESRGVFTYKRYPPDRFQPPVAEALIDHHFLCRNARSRPFVVVSVNSGRPVRWTCSPLHPDLQLQYQVERVLGLHLRSENVRGWLLLLDRPGMATDELELGEFVARQAASDLERHYVQQYLPQAAATEERIRLARDLHDSVLQSFTGIALQLETLTRTLVVNPHSALHHIHEIQRLITQEQRDLREFIQQLKPQKVEGTTAHTGLAASLEEVTKRIERQWEIQVELILQLERGDVPASLAYDVYRLVREAVINAARHADASLVRVTLTRCDPWLHITVADDGHGFPFHGRYDLTALNSLRIGPRSLTERIASLKGTMVLWSITTGVRIEMGLPLGTDAEPELPCFIPAADTAEF